MGLKFRRGSTAQQSGSLAFGEPYVNTTLGTLVVGGATGDIVLSAGGTGSTGNFGAISGSGLDITGNANIAGNLTLGGNITIGDNTSDTVSMTANLSSSIIPSLTNTFDLGSPSKQWRHVYISTGSLYMNGTAILSSTATDLTLTTDTGQSLKLLETAADTITLQTAEGNLTLTSTGAGDVILDPNTGVVSIKGTLQVQDGNKITSSGGNTIQFGNNVAITGSLTTTTGLTVGGDFVVNGTTTTIDSTNINIGDNIIVLNGTLTTNGGMYVKDAAGGNTATGSMLWDTTNDRWIAGPKGSELAILRVGGDSVVSSSTQIPALLPTGVVSGSSQIIANLPTDTVSGSSQITYASISSIPAGIVSGSAQTIANLPTGVVSGSLQISYPSISSIPGGIVSGSSQITYASISSIPGGIVSGSTQVTPLLPVGTVSGSSQVISILSSLNTYTGSNDTTNATQNTSLTNLNTATGSLITRLNAVETATSSYETKGRGIFSGSAQVTGLTNTNLNGTAGITNANLANSTITIAGTSTALGGTIAASTIGNAIGAFSGSSQVSLTATTGYGTYINQAVLTTSTPTFAALTINGAITATGDITAYYSSDKRFKSNIQLIPNALEKVSKLNGVTWTWNEDVNEVTKTTPNTGLIAQEVQEVLPEVVMERADGHLGLDYSKMMGLLVEAIKEQQTQIHSLTIEIENLKKDNSL